MTPLRQRMIEDMQVRNLSPHTIDCYVRQVALFARYFNRSPELLGPDEIRAYQLHLVHERKLGWGSFNQAVCALHFLYLKTLGKDWNIESIPFAKQPKKVPLVLSQDEVRAVLEAITNPQNRVIAMILYAAGLRVSEAVSLRIADIDSKRMLLHVVQGKGRKDRLVTLSPVLLPPLALPLPTLSAPLLAVSQQDLSRPPRHQGRGGPRHHRGAPRRRRQAGIPAYLAPLFRHPSAGIRHRSAHRPGAARTRLDQQHRDLHPRHAQAHHRGRQSTGIVATAALSCPCTSHRSK